MEEFSALAHVLRGSRRRCLAVKPERFHADVLKRRDRIRHAVRGRDAVVVEDPGVAGRLGLSEQDRVRGLDRDVVVKEVERREEEGGRGEVCACVGRVLGLRKVVHADVDPRDEIGLRDVFAVEELVEVDGGRSGKVEVPLATRRGLGLLALRDCEVVARPVGVVQEAFGSNDRL